MSSPRPTYFISCTVRIHSFPGPSRIMNVSHTCIGKDHCISCTSLIHSFPRTTVFPALVIHAFHGTAACFALLSFIPYQSPLLFTYALLPFEENNKSCTRRMNALSKTTAFHELVPSTPSLEPLHFMNQSHLCLPKDHYISCTSHFHALSWTTAFHTNVSFTCSQGQLH